VNQSYRARVALKALSFVNDHRQAAVCLLGEIRRKITVEDLSAPLVKAADGGHLSVVKLLIEHEADPQADDGRAFFWALSSDSPGRDAVVKFMLPWIDLTRMHAIAMESQPISWLSLDRLAMVAPTALRNSWLSEKRARGHYPMARVQARVERAWVLADPNAPHACASVRCRGQAFSNR
jgi:hypothetical protein